MSAANTQNIIKFDDWGLQSPKTRRSLVCLQRGPIEDTLVSDLCSAGWAVQVVKSAHDAQKLIDNSGCCVGLVILGDKDCEYIQQEMEELMMVSQDVIWIGLLPSGFKITEDICQLISKYFSDYHSQPVDLERLLITLGHAYGMAQMQHKLRVFQGAESSGYDEIIGRSPVMRQLIKKIGKVASVEAPVLITGESGAGKELVAHAIHRQSSRSEGPFVAVNCGALPASLIQSELFGHEKGAFTGAHQQRQGRFELAEQGTLFLDEVGDLPLDLQVNLLRFLEEKVIERLGGTSRIPVNTRVIAATHVDLQKAVADGRFRMDLYYRLNVLHLNVPSLREREGDIELLARFLFKKFAAENYYPAKGFSRQALQVLEQHSWPGNVRELMNRVHQAMIMCEGGLIQPADLELDRRVKRQSISSLEEARAVSEKQAIASALRWTRKNISQAAQELGVSRTTLYRLMEKYGIKA